MEKSTLILAVATIGVTLLTIAINPDNIWYSPNFQVQVENLEKNEKDKKPVDEIVRTIYNERNYMPINATWLRLHDADYFQILKETKGFSSEDLWILDRIYNLDTDGLSQKLSITNTGYNQAHDVLVQISGINNFKIIEYTCPELMSEDQIVKKFGKNYVISLSRMSVKLVCEIIINSVGDSGIEQVIVTASESNPRVWPTDLINDLRTASIIITITLYVLVGALAVSITYNVSKKYGKKINQKRKTPL